MPTVLEGKRVVLGVTGSVACYKAADLASKLVQGGASVDVVLTASAARFVSPLTFAALTHRPVVTNLFDPTGELGMDHVALATRADAVIVAPATANTLAKLANGLADDALTATVLATSAPVLVAPAGDARMFQAAVTIENLGRLRSRGIVIVGPAEGRLASGMVGSGRLVEPDALVGHLRALLGKDGDYAGRKVVVSAGGTQEPIDPVRILTNRSSGRMGYAIAEAARDRGADVVLVSAPTALPDPAGVRLVRVNTVAEMRDAVTPESQDADLLVMAAAVSDFRIAERSDHKIKKSGSETFSLTFAKNEDWLPRVNGPRLVKVAFAAETEDLIENARTKLASKGAKLVVANDVTIAGAGFGTATNQVAIINERGEVESLPLMDKYDVAQKILDRALPLLVAPRTGE